MHDILTPGHALLLITLLYVLLGWPNVGKNDCDSFLLPYSYSLYESKYHALMEYNDGLEKPILKNSELNDE